MKRATIRAALGAALASLMLAGCVYYHPVPVSSGPDAFDRSFVAFSEFVYDYDHLAERLVCVGEKLFLIDHAAGEIAGGDRGAGWSDRDAECYRTGGSQFQHSGPAAAGRLAFPDFLDESLSFQIFDDG